MRGGKKKGGVLARRLGFKLIHAPLQISLVGPHSDDILCQQANLTFKLAEA